MKRLLLPLLSALVLPTAVSSKNINIESCYDGDTCTSTQREKIRLACIFRFKGDYEYNSKKTQ